MSFSIRSLFKRVAVQASASVAPAGNRSRAQELVDRGIAAEDSGASAQALQCYRQAIEADPGFAPAHMNLGIALQAAEDLAGAIASYRSAITLDRGYAAAHYNLAMARLSVGQYAEAEDDFRMALRLRAEFPEAWVGLAEALGALGRDNEALAALENAVRQRKDYAGALLNTGGLLQKMGRLSEAEAIHRRTLKLKPDYTEAHDILGHVLLSLGRVSEAMACHRRALELKPGFHEAYSNLLFCLSHDENVSAQALYAEHRRFGEIFETPLRSSWPPHPNSRDPERGLQIGFVSGDLRDHAAGRFIEPMLVQLARYPRISLHAYSNHAIEDNVTRRLRRQVSQWHRIAGLSDQAVAQAIRDDGIDVLVDLSGHSAGHRLLSFARRPAPVQASWIGYPGTTGLLAMDYYLADRFLLPPGQFDDQFTERIVRLPAWASYLPPESAPPVGPLPALSNGIVTFGSFNRPSKLSESVIALWAQLLRASPGARMLLAAMPGDGSVDALAGWFAREGIAPERLDFHARCGMDAYLAMHQQVDLCLDTFPYSGSTTTYHALWMGVPTLTLAGRTLPGRLSAGALGHLGLEGFVAHDAADFVLKGRSWASKVSALAALRAGLRGRFEQSLLCRPGAVAAGVGSALRSMWRRWCAGLPAESFEVRPECSKRS
ncbi:MAG: tetratricopeptide repeat protein [Betaproteobacteria bacterium]|nr:tetratricopeptide repeat protein [Betaproteobacteria bacterium]